MDADQWKVHGEDVEKAYAADKEAWNKKQDEIEAQMKEIQVCGGVSEASQNLVPCANILALECPGSIEAGFCWVGTEQ